MEIMPSEYQQQELTRTEKLFVRYAESVEDFGYLLLNTNAAMIEGEKQHIVLVDKGVLMVKFFDTFIDPALFETVMKAYYTGVYAGTYTSVRKKLSTNKALLGADGKLSIGFSYICIFPNLDKINSSTLSGEFKEFVESSCLFKEDMLDLKKDYLSKVQECIDKKKNLLSTTAQVINDKNVNSVLQRIAPEYTTIRVSEVEDKSTYKGVDDSLLVVTPDDVAVRAFMLDPEQINIVNKIMKGDQLILACAGSGKSVILISKCFKAARMNPDKKFLLTCKSRQLQALYTWYIDRAGLREKNVECITFHKLCKKLTEISGSYVTGDPEYWPAATIARFNQGYIKDRYYGIFIDEVQLFDQEWYKLCFNLLENKESGEHLFVICGDKTQEIVKRQKRGTAPWNAGEGYPNYRGGNKSIRIEKNYRNCAEVNSYINRYVSYAKKIYGMLPGGEVDPDMFLRGKSVRNGTGTFVKLIEGYTSRAEAKTVMKAIHEAHDVYKIPYDEIAVIMYNKTYPKKMKGWQEQYYNLERFLLIEMVEEHMPHSMMYATQNADAVRYGANDGVGMISFESVLGLDFRAVIVCGLKPFGDYDKTKYLCEDDIEALDEDDDSIESIRNNIRMLYVACTRARDILYIIQPEDKDDSLYMRMLLDAMEEE